MANGFNFDNVNADLKRQYADAIVTLQKLTNAEVQALASAAAWTDTTAPCVAEDDEDFEFLLVAADSEYVFVDTAVGADLKVAAAQTYEALKQGPFWIREQISTANIAGENGTTRVMTFASEAEFIAAMVDYKPNFGALIFNSGASTTPLRLQIHKVDDIESVAFLAEQAGWSAVGDPVFSSANAGQDAALERVYIANWKKKK